MVKEAGQEGRLPVAIITHGQAAEAEARERMEPRSYFRVARDFARRGWLAVVVVRRGFGRSEGQRPFALRGCSKGEYGPALDAQADDLDEALKAIGRRHDADATQAIALGVSVGGAAVLSWAARSPAGLKAVINVSGGVANRPREGAQLSCTPGDLVQAFAALGERSRIATLWLYAENDSLFPPELVRHLHEAYVAKGGRTDFHMFVPVGKNGHNLLADQDGMLRWIPVLDCFLRANSLKTFDQTPLDATLKSLNLNAGQRQWAARYFGRPTEKAMALSVSNGKGQVFYGGANLREIERRVIEECEEIAKEPCRIVLRNFEVAPNALQ